MNQAIRNSWIVAIALFALLFGAVSYVQFFAVDSLNANPQNDRQLVASFCSNRGPILVDGQAIAESVPSGTDCKYQRTYNDPELYAGLTGFFSKFSGQYGLEAQMRDELTGNSDSALFDRIAQAFTGEQQQGRSVELTIDSTIQKMAYDMIPDDVGGSIVAMNPKTGAIIAMVSKPSYDTNLMATHNKADFDASMAKLVDVPGINLFGSPAYTKLYAPGSVFKIIDTAAALESGKYNKDSVLPNPAELAFPGINYALPNYANGQCYTKDKATFAFALENSCNTPFASIALDLGQDAITAQAEKFGFNDTSLKFPDRVVDSRFPGSDGTLDDPSLAQSAIGQKDVLASPLQIAMMTAAIANGGEQMAPNLVKTIRTPDLKTVSSLTPEVLRQSTTPEIAAQIKDWMVSVVDNGIGSAAAVPGVQVAAKTGTAELGLNESGVMMNNAWFTGFAPANDPEVVVTIVMPKVDVATGAQLTSPNASKLFKAVLNK
ncbi:peptidoglycan glycosyltransferase [Arthrobacter alpinus]|uniref:peptidoglycan D,D-transpeptidase FtsI family protein n=1 Tax=Arthrobacter alpinus TaxID=656366 RepID=UPI0005C9BC64|nr:penicillin-binding transpeptidase domain-containing protein [Arthrobacter alpinus]ALV46808.1 peptidoglycan glycosyltransferase [Arthrobacter alpinus]